MIINGVNIPEDLLKAIEENNLVVFVGAGVSMGAPTNLPDFKKLVHLVELGTGEVYDDEEPCEKFLGRLNHKHINVHEKVARIFSEIELQHNDLHRFIIDLFSKNEDIKIVTTNYDTMFEQVLHSRGIDGVKIYDSPALPLGNNIKGIVHIHGNINDCDSMVLTDEDFGKAYITEGYVSNFLVKLFESYNVLFVGYSYDDTIVKYLTRALTNYTQHKRFILIESDSKEFEILGLQPICFGKGNFTNLYQIIEHLGIIYNRGLLDWKNTIQLYEEIPPNDISLESEIEYCMKDESKALLLSKTVHGEKWFEWFKLHEVFYPLFNEQTILSKIDKIWLEWLFTEFLGKKDDLIKRLILENNNHLNVEFISELTKKLCNSKLNISNTDFCDYINLILNEINDGLDLNELIIISFEKELYQVAFLLFKNLFKYKFLIKKKFFSQKDELEYECEFLIPSNFMNYAWETNGTKLVEKFPIEFMEFAHEMILSIYSQYQSLNMVKEGWDPLNNLFFSLEREYHFSDLEKVIFEICNAIIIAANIAKKINKDYVKGYIIRCLKSESILIKNIGIKLLRTTSIFSCDKSCKLLIKNIGIYKSFEKEQIFLLVASFFNKLSLSMQGQLLFEIEKGDMRFKNDEEELKTAAYEKFNWCAWLNKNGINHPKIEEIRNNVLREYHYFKERTHPELLFEEPAAKWGNGVSPKSEDEIMAMSPKDLMHLLKTFKEDKWRDITKEGLYNAFGNCLKTDFDWSINMLNELHKYFEGDHPVWKKVISKLSEAEMSIEQHIKLLNLFISNESVVKYCDLDIAWYLEKLIDNHKDNLYLNPLLDQIFELSLKVYELGDKKSVCESDLITKCLNCSTGVLLITWIKMLSIEENVEKQKKYYDLFEELLNDKKYNVDQILCVLAGNVRFFYFNNSEWCKNRILPFLTSKDNIEFKSTWDGIAYFSNQLYKEFGFDFQNVYLDTITRITELNKHGREILVGQYTLLMIYVVENPLERFIPKFFEVAEKEDKLQLIKMIKNCLGHMNDSEKVHFWSSWLKKYWNNRIDNIPKELDDYENTKMLNWCLKLGELFPEAVEIIKKVNLKKVDNYFFITLEHSTLMQIYPNDIVRLITYILNSDAEIDRIDYVIPKILGNVQCTDQTLNNELSEALLRRGIID